MAQKTYLIGLYFAAYALFRYISKHYNKMLPNLTAPQKACLDATLEAVNECIQVFAPAPPVE